MAKAIITFTDTEHGPGIELQFIPHLEPEELDKMTHAQAIAEGVFSAVVKKMLDAEK